MRNIFIGLLAAFSLLCGVVAAESQTRKTFGASSGYCPQGSCNMRGENGGAVKDMANCSPKNCSGGGSSPQKQQKK